MNRFGLFCAAGLMAGGVLVSAQVPAAIPEPRRGAGASVTGAFEGWYYNPDGTRSFLIGYYNRNQQQELDIPIGPNNHIDPGGPDVGQPTHFLTGRQWGMFSVPVPRAFKDTDSYFWEITANGQTTAIPLSLKTDWEISPLVEASVGNTPPTISFEEKGPSVQGPQGMMVERSGKSGMACGYQQSPPPLPSPRPEKSMPRLTRVGITTR